jgi:ABC-type multidrug transport system fused ATPase/permease subunit
LVFGASTCSRSPAPEVTGRYWVTRFSRLLASCGHLARGREQRMPLLDKVLLLGKILEILDRNEKTRLLVLTGMMVVGAGLEVFGIGAVTSFIGVLASPDVIREHAVLSSLYQSTGAGSVQEFLTYAGVFLILVFIVKNGYLAFLIHSQTKFAFQKEVALSGQLLTAYLRNPYTFHLQRNSADLVKNATVEVSHVVTGVLMPALVLLTEGIVLAFVLILLAAVEPMIALTIFVLLGTVALTFIRVVKPVLNKAGRLRSTSSGSRIKWVNQALGSIKETKLLGREEFFIRKFHESTERYAQSGLTANILNNLPRLIVEIVAVSAILAVFLVAQNQSRNLQDLLPVLVLFSLAAMRLMPSVNRMTPAFNQLRYWFPALETVHHDLRTASYRNRRVTEESASMDRTNEVLASEVALRNVCYRHPGSHSWSVRDVSLTIPRGSSVAFMGPSGAGKSTLVDLILGLIDPDDGEILIDGRPLNEIRTGWQRKIGYVPQSIYLTDDTVRRNVALGVTESEIDNVRVWTALRGARLDDMIRRLPEQLETEVGERGIRLSGGERQRVGIARALYHNPDILVFDEATSALDIRTEREIVDTINALTGEKTVIVVAHRLSTIRNCDTIFMIEDGRVTDSGTLDQLAARNADFRQLAGEERRQPAH